METNEQDDEDDDSGSHDLNLDELMKLCDNIDTLHEEFNGETEVEMHAINDHNDL